MSFGKEYTVLNTNLKISINFRALMDDLKLSKDSVNSIF